MQARYSNPAYFHNQFDSVFPLTGSMGTTSILTHLSPSPPCLDLYICASFCAAGNTFSCTSRFVAQKKKFCRRVGAAGTFWRRKINYLD